MTRNTIYLNKATVGVTDRSFFYGDGCFTTIAYRNKHLELFDRHISRLQNDCEKLGISWPDWNDLVHQVTDFACAASTDCIYKIVISRGEGGRGYAPAKDCLPIAYVNSFPLPVMLIDRSVALGIAETELIDHPRLAGVKHNNRLIQVLAKQELAALKEHGSQIDDLLLCNSSGEIIEATSANFFYMKNNRWYTPYVNSEGVVGVMREYVLQMMCDAGQSVSKKNLSFDVLPDVQAAFLTNAVMQVTPVSSLNDDHHLYPLNLGLSRQVQRRVSETLQERHT